jgi:hypothetical protein
MIPTVHGHTSPITMLVSVRSAMTGLVPLFAEGATITLMAVLRQTELDIRILPAEDLTLSGDGAYSGQDSCC